MDLPTHQHISRRDIRDILVLTTIPIILAIIYYHTPHSFQTLLALDHTGPQPHAFWTNALVHRHEPGDKHLTGNLIAYALLTYPSWLLYRIRNTRRQFWAAFTTFLLVTPIAGSLTSYITFHELLGFTITNDRGFSGVIGAITSFLLMTIIYTVADTQEDRAATISIWLYTGYLVIGLGILTNRFIVTALGFMLLVAAGIALATKYNDVPDVLFTWGDDHFVLAVVLIAAALTSTIGFAASLPADITSDDSIKNIFAHAAGLLIGMLVALMLRYRTQQSFTTASGEGVVRD
jgi:hypothetical protein